MKLNSFTAGNVHGYLNYNINFFPELTFLIGINGSGKTSALKLILGLISPSYQYLSQIEYDYAELTCSTTDNERDIIITAKQNNDNSNFSIQLKSSTFKEKPQAFPRFEKNTFASIDSEEITLRERSLKEQFDTNEITKAIRELATPKFLGLDRKIYEGRNIDVQMRRRQLLAMQKYKRRSTPFSTSTAIDASLDDVQYLIFDYFRKIAQQQPKISEEFKRKIFELSFKFNENSQIISNPIGLDELLDKKEKVIEAINNLDLDFLDSTASLFFSKMQTLLTTMEKLEKKESATKNQKIKNRAINRDNRMTEKMNVLFQWVNNSFQMKQIEEIIKFSRTYQEKIDELRSPIKRLEDIASNFLKEGKKCIEIAEDGEIKVKLNNDNYANLYELSSGEKQIIIMIAHLIFEEDQKPSGVFIIDEPEISLHIAWQEIFIDAIQEASPKTQFILATHSPSIISKVSREKFCQDLNELNY